MGLGLGKGVRVRVRLGLGFRQQCGAVQLELTEVRLP